MKPEASTFERYEKKYLLEPWQAQSLQPWILEHFQPDRYPESVICNVYFDTEDYELIRTSIEKPHYKEKLRLRSYGVPKAYSQVFIELKKKYDGVVYKRRIPMRLENAEKYLYSGIIPEGHSQILSEIQWFVEFYEPKPAVFLAYDRRAYFGKEQEEFRVTFDENIRYREEQLHLADGDQGIGLLPENIILMEVKIPDSMPFWLGHILSELEIFPISFSKYGTYYKENLTHLFGEGLLYA